MAPSSILIGTLGSRVALFLFIILILAALFVTLVVVLIRALTRSSKSDSPAPPPPRTEEQRVRKTLAEALKSHRTRCGMTQEYVAESLGVSRQAVSKWENGTSDPSTANLIALARLYGTSVETLLQDVAPN